MKRKRDKKTVPLGKALRLSFRVLRLWYKRYPGIILSRVATTVWWSLTPYVGIYLSALVVDELAGARDPDRLKTLVLLTLFAAAAVSLGSALLGRWRGIQNGGMWWTMQNMLKDKFLEMDYVDTESTGTSSLYTNICNHMNSNGWGITFAVDIMESMLSAVLRLFGGVSLTVSLFVSRVPDGAGAYKALDHPLTALFVIAVLLALTCLSPMLGNRAGRYWAEHANDHKFANSFFSFFGNLGTIREYAEDVRIYRQWDFCDKYGMAKDYTFGSKGVFAKLARGPMGAYSAASAAVSVAFTGAVYLFVCLKAWAGAFGLGAVTQYVASVSRMAQSVGKLVGALGDLRNNAPFLELNFAFLDIPNKMYQGSLTVEKRRDRKYEVEFRDVSFRYPGSKTYALRHVSIKFEIGKRLAVVGQNGSGKTTFIKLLCRLYDPTEGVILLNGIDIRKYNYAEYMQIFSIVFQDFKLFAMKLGENVAVKTAYDEERVKDCLEKAGFGERLAELPDGLETYLYKKLSEKGVDISGGEAQKIAIARALCKDSPFIVLDEPTAALDPLAEAEIYAKFNDIAGDKTAIYISHRLSSCKFCDEILVFDEGRVVQQGTHAALESDVGGKYHELWHAQAQYYTE